MNLDAARQSAARAALTPLWDGHTDHLPAWPKDAPCVAAQTNRTAAESDAVARALVTPDILVIAESEQSNRSIGLEIAQAFAGRGDRVLRITAKPPTIDPQWETIRAAVEARQAGRWWTVNYWRAVFHPSWNDEYNRRPRNITHEIHANLDKLRGHWDAVVIEDASLIQRAALLELAKLANRCILIGKLDEPDSDFAALWRSLAKPAWNRDGDRLQCILRPLSNGARQHLNSEPLADAPEIELRIFNPIAERPELAEVIFPPGTTLAQGKEFIGRYLDEWPIDLYTAGLKWSESANEVVACLGCNARHSPMSVEVTSGVRELIAERPNGHGTLPWFTCGFTFARQAGWDRVRAEEWLAGRLNGRSTGRAVRIEAIE